jgi:DNA-binding NtrC family response regulator
VSSTLDLDRVTQALEAVAWAQGHLPELIACDGDAEVLGALVDIARRRTGAPVAWAVSWIGDIQGGEASFEAMASAGGATLPAPSEISRTVLGWVAREGRPAWSDEAMADERFASSHSVVIHDLRSVGCVPIGPRGALYVADPREPGRFGAADRLALPALCAIAAPFLARPAEGRHRRPPEPLPGLVGSSAAMAALFRAVRAFAPMPWPALILGETGTGKESVARAIHTLSPRAKGPFVAVNCATIPDELAEGTLFGHERGAFTGADRRREGVVERAAGGTLFLDEVAELSPRVQPKVLRLLQEGTFERVGGEREMRADARIVAATHQGLDDDAARGSFRADLYHRLAACVIRVPSLNDRRGDVPALADHLLGRACAQLAGTPKLTLSAGATAALAGRTWPGNVRELENTLRAAVARCLAEGQTQIRTAHLSDAERGHKAAIVDNLEAATDAFVQERVMAALAGAGGNRSKAAVSLGVSRQWLHKLLARWEE